MRRPSPFIQPMTSRLSSPTRKWTRVLRGRENHYHIMKPNKSGDTFKHLWQYQWPRLWIALSPHKRVTSLHYLCRPCEKQYGFFIKGILGLYYLRFRGTIHII